jgi:hypothetical protein
MHAVKLVILGRDGILNQFRETTSPRPRNGRPCPARWRPWRG